MSKKSNKSLKNNKFQKILNLIFIIVLIIVFLFVYFYENYYNLTFISNDKIIDKISHKNDFKDDEYIEKIEYKIKGDDVIYHGVSVFKEKKTNFYFVINKKEIESINGYLKTSGKYNKSPTIIHKTNTDYVGNVINFIYMLSLFVPLIIVYFLSKKENNSKITHEKPNIFFQDIAGYEEEKKEIKKIINYLKKPDIFTKMGAKLPKGILFSGPPGTGKTLFAKVIATEAGVPFYYSSGSEFEELYVGLGALRVRNLFSDARKNSPCVIFIDEIDSIGRNRGINNSVSEQTLNQFLTEIDGFKANSGILVIAATNRIEVLDKALTRSGRFDKIIVIPLPNKNDREAIFKVHSRNKKLCSDVDFKLISSRTVGLSGADIESIMNEAAILAVHNDHKEITLANVDEAIDRKILGLAKESYIFSEKEKKIIAFHESGHAIIGLTLPDSDKVRKVSIIPRGYTGGHVLISPENDKFLYTKEEIFARIVGYLGGRASEEIFFQTMSNGAANDIEVATYLARLMVVDYGMSDLGPIKYDKTGFFDPRKSSFNFSEQTFFEIDQEVKKIVDSAFKKAKVIINQRKKDVELIAQKLLEKETLTFEQIEYFFKEQKEKVKKLKEKKNSKDNDVENKKHID